MIQTPRFVNKNKTDFYKVLIQRVDKYFAENKLSKHADAGMVFKTIVMLAFYFVPYGIIMSGILPLWAMWLGTVVMGFGLAGIGMSVMHDANHGAYTSSHRLNQLIGYSLNLVGGDADNWKIQHNKLHHTYTNIHGFDLDIRENAGLRFTPGVKHKPFQRFQLFYVFFLYALQTFFWVFMKDFMQFERFRKSGDDGRDKSARTNHLLIMFFTKLIYVLYILILPMLVLDITWWQLLIGFMTMHAVGGFTLAIVFQLAHVVEGVHFPVPDETGKIENEWAIHQMHTTSNFAPNNKWVSYYVGGLNYQIEHHLFTRVCHIHYPQIAPIVQQTAKEFGIPYLTYDTLTEAFASHVSLMGKLGRNEVFQVATDIG
ncbi:MAG: acyl-CoA desaturase [Bacteroidota bacterium]